MATFGLFGPTVFSFVVVSGCELLYNSVVVRFV